MKFPGAHPRTNTRPSRTPDVTSEVMDRLGFCGIDGSPGSLKRAHRRYLLKRSALFLGMVLVILSAALLERDMSEQATSGERVPPDQTAAFGASGVNSLTALQAFFQNIDSSLSATEAGEAPVAELSDDHNQDARPLEGPILVPEYFGDASASLTSS